MTIWLRAHSTHVLIGLALAILPLIYCVYAGVSWSPLRPHEHLIQNGLAYCFLVLFSYLNHTVFVPHWFLTKRYRRYIFIAVSCILAAVYFPYRIEQWIYFKLPSENTPLAWARQLFVEEMMLPKPAGQSHHSLSNDHRHAFESFDKQHSLSSHPFDAGHDGHHGPPFTLLLPVKLAIFFCWAVLVPSFRFPF